MSFSSKIPAAWTAIAGGVGALALHLVRRQMWNRRVLSTATAVSTKTKKKNKNKPTIFKEHFQTLRWQLTEISLKRDRLSTPSAQLARFSSISSNEWNEEKTSIDEFLTARGFPSVIFNLPPHLFEPLAEQLMQEEQSTGDKVAASVTAPSFESSLQPLIDVEARLRGLANSLTFLKNVSPDEKVRAASSATSRALAAFEVEQSMRRDVYLAVQAFAETEEAGALTGEHHRFLEHVLRDFQRAGLALPNEEDRDRLETIKKQMSDLSIEFAQNLNEEDTRLSFTKEELAGMPQDFIDSLQKVSDSKYELTLKYPHVVPTMQKCSVESTRQAIEQAYNSRCADKNLPIMAELAQLRSEMASLLGFNSYSEFALSTLMAKKPEAVLDLLGNVSTSLEPLAEKERTALLDIKATERASQGLEPDPVLRMWDFKYYQARLEERDYQLDQNAIKDYFPLDKVTKGMLEIYQSLLGLRFVESSPEEFEAWHPDVRQFQVYNAAEEEKDLVGIFYLDLHPRPNKYGHAAVWPLRGGSFAPPDNKWQHPIVAMVCNFAAPTKDRPSLLSHTEVVTYFHEFGHVMHGICSKAHLMRFAGTAVERDFVEAPSQMLENWCWEEESLRLMSGHYQTGVEMPAEMIKSLVRSKVANAGLLAKRQLVFGIFDQRLHSSSFDGKDPSDVDQLFASTLKEVLGIDATPSTSFVSGFGHLAGGYEARYYGYMWAEVFSADMFATAFAKRGGGLMDPANGKRYRDIILARGGSMDAGEFLEEFLGRKPNMDAFLASKGL